MPMTRLKLLVKVGCTSSAASPEALQKGHMPLLILLRDQDSAQSPTVHMCNIFGNYAEHTSSALSCLM